MMSNKGKIYYRIKCHTMVIAANMGFYYLPIVEAMDFYYQTAVVNNGILLCIAVFVKSYVSNIQDKIG